MYSSPSGAPPGRILCARGGARPGDLAGPVRHVLLDPGPQAVELRLVVELDGRHHAVRHAFGAHVAVVDVLHVGFVRAGSVEVDGARARRAEQGRPRLAELRIGVRLRVAGEGDEEIRVSGGRLAPPCHRRATRVAARPSAGSNHHVPAGARASLPAAAASRVPAARAPGAARGGAAGRADSAAAAASRDAAGGRADGPAGRAAGPPRFPSSSRRNRAFRPCRRPPRHCRPRSHRYRSGSRRDQPEHMPKKMTQLDKAHRRQAIARDDEGGSSTSRL